eukprot:TRINITY_DN3730_c0_g2_i6.p2 TRINITY_DN3730_c0_g2~~TRINITY_DN3730_c0_g2_i6.p2  ORF type:complete len:248 (+),score=72.69 TRINITY_DN3730_c0_g2_i6:100-843(+)
MRGLSPCRVSDAMAAARPKAGGASWVCCFTCNAQVFHFVEGLDAAGLERIASASPAREAAPELVLAPLRQAQEASRGEWVRVPGAGAAWVVRRGRVALVAPLSSKRLIGLCLYGNKVVGWLLRIRARIMSEQAYISTLGGGFASVRNIPKAVEYAVKLFYCGCLLGDEDLKGVQRGFGAMHQLEYNPSSKDKGDVLPDPALQWQQVFAKEDQSQQIKRDALTRGYEISEMTRDTAAAAEEKAAAAEE